MQTNYLEILKKPTICYLEVKVRLSKIRAKFSLIAQIISEVKTTKIIGMIIHSRLNWKHHINSICNKVS